MDKGSESVPCDLDLWAYQRGIARDFSRPGKPIDNAFMLVDVVVVYKIDRLSRSLMDFAKLVDVFDRNDVTFVSVTQSLVPPSRWGG